MSFFFLPLLEIFLVNCGYSLILQVPLYKHIADLSDKSNPLLPVPAITVISGGKHAGNNLAVQV